MDAILALLANRIVITQLVTLALALFASTGLPPIGASVVAIVAVVMLAGAALTAIFRFGHPGQPAADAKHWYQSRIIWAQIITAVFAALALVGAMPAALDPEAVLETVMALVAIVTVAFGAKIDAAIHR